MIAAVMNKIRAIHTKGITITITITMVIKIQKQMAQVLCGYHFPNKIR